MEFRDTSSNSMKKIGMFFFILLLTLGILFMAFGTFAQNTLYVGPYLGIGNQQSYNSNFYNDPSVKVTNIPGVSFGATLQDSLISNVYVGFGLGYSSFSTEAQYTDKTSEDGILTGNYYNCYGYINAPLSITYKSKTTSTNTFGFFGEFELIPSYNTNATQKETPGGSALTLDTTTSSLVNIKNQTHTFNLMMGISGGLLIGMNNMMLMIGPYYTTSLSDINKFSAPYYTTVSGKTEESYTPTLMQSIGASITVAIKINTRTAKLAAVSSTNGTK